MRHGSRAMVTIAWFALATLPASAGAYTATAAVQLRIDFSLPDGWPGSPVNILDQTVEFGPDYLNPGEGYEITAFDANDVQIQKSSYTNNNSSQNIIGCACTGGQLNPPLTTKTGHLMLRAIGGAFDVKNVYMSGSISITKITACTPVAGGCDPVETVWDTFPVSHGIAMAIGDVGNGYVYTQAVAFEPSASGFMQGFSFAAWETADWQFSLRSDANGQPGTILETIFPVQVRAADLTRYDVVAAGTTLLLSGVRYWLTASIPAAGSRGSWSVITSGTGTKAYSLDGGSTWTLQNEVLVGAAQIRVFPVSASLKLGTSTVAGCKSVNGIVTLATPAPAGGIEITLSDTLASASVPASLRVRKGTTTGTFTVNTTPLTVNETGTVKATLGGTTVSQNLTVRPMGIASVGLKPSKVVGGKAVSGSANLECKAAPGEILIELSSSMPDVANPSTPSIVVPAGTQSASFQVMTSPVATKATTSISATANGVSASTALTVLP